MIVAGFGCRRAATLDSLEDAYDRARGPHRADRIATLADKAGALQPLATRLGVPLVVLSRQELERQPTLTQSPASQAAHGIGSLSEAAALAGAGPKARLLAPRAVSQDRMATCALAWGEAP